MRRILIVGAGQAGLQLAHELLDHNYDVTVMSPRTPEQIRQGQVMSSQCLFNTALQHERDGRLNLWEQDAPRIERLGLTVGGPDGQPRVHWDAPLDHYAQAVDQRIKMASWLELVEARGGTLLIRPATVAALDALAASYDLVVVSTGGDDLGEMFRLDAARSSYSSPQRVLSLAYVHGLTPRPEYSGPSIGYLNIIPGIGELFMIPAYTRGGACDILFFEGIPGGPLDCWSDRPEPAEHLQRLLDLVQRYVPWEYRRCGQAELTDPGGTLVGQVTPAVRRPVAELSCGRHALAMADAVVLNDPITAQGANFASRCAVRYAERIFARGHRPFDRQWMQGTFDGYWADAQHATRWTNAMLRPPAHVRDLLAVAADNPDVAHRFANGFDNPADFADWLIEPDRATAYLASVSATV
jgi:hypothetical protein